MLAVQTNQNLILADIQLVEQWRASKKGMALICDHIPHGNVFSSALIHQCPKAAILFQLGVFIHLVSLTCPGNPRFDWLNVN